MQDSRDSTWWVIWWRIWALCLLRRLTTFLHVGMGDRISNSICINTRRWRHLYHHVFSLSLQHWRRSLGSSPIPGWPVNILSTPSTGPHHPSLHHLRWNLGSSLPPSPGWGVQTLYRPSSEFTGPHYPSLHHWRWNLGSSLSPLPGWLVQILYRPSSESTGPPHPSLHHWRWNLGYLPPPFPWWLIPHPRMCSQGFSFIQHAHQHSARVTLVGVRRTLLHYKEDSNRWRHLLDMFEAALQRSTEDICCMAVRTAHPKS